MQIMLTYIHLYFQIHVLCQCFKIPGIGIIITQNFKHHFSVKNKNAYEPVNK